MWVFDIETDGLLPDLTRIHCIVLRHLETGVVHRFNDQPADAETLKDGDIAGGLEMLAAQDAICGHNAIAFDIPAIQHLYPDWTPSGRVVDTLVLSRLLYADAFQRDCAMERRKRGKWIPKQLYGRHSLEAWGQRLGFQKDDYAARCKAEGVAPWARWSEEMETYCVQDTAVTAALYHRLAPRITSQQSVDLEHAVAAILFRQEQRGFAFDQDAAVRLQMELVARKTQITSKLWETFKPFYISKGVTEPKRSMNRKAGVGGLPKEEYTAGASYTKATQTEFNPASRAHIERALRKQFGWKPKEFTPDGRAKLDEDVLASLPYSPAPLLAEYFTVDKRLGQLAEGRHAWLKLVEEDGRIHGSVNPNGAVTGRMTHRNPNMAQVPRSTSPYGEQCRALFIAGPGYVLVGCDAEGLELRMLAHYLARWDDGAFAEAVVSGDKAEGTDAHSLNAAALELSRDGAKTWLYGRIYGAGDVKLGHIVLDDWANTHGPEIRRQYRSEARIKRLGRDSRVRMESRLPALEKLVSAVQGAVARKGYLVGLDGRHIRCRSGHSAVNALLQGAGAVVMKRSLVILDEELLPQAGLTHKEIGYVANVHDEFQAEVRPDRAARYGELAARSIELAGERLGVRCRLAGEYKIGGSWAETH